MSLPSISDAFVSRDPDCPSCLGSGHVCENHPNLPWDGIDPAHVCCVHTAHCYADTLCPQCHPTCGCGGGAPCPRCTSEARMD